MSALTEAIRVTLATYGRVGLLVDDDDGAKVRLARELYGSEILPAWWLRSRSASCAARSLTWLMAELERTPAQAILVFDRYLPPKCSDSRAVPWDRDDAEGARQLQDAWAQLSQFTTASPRRVWIVTQTSHTQVGSLEGPGPTKFAPPAWRTRSSELIHALRNDISQAGARTLLEFGPSSQSWTRAVRSVANALSGTAPASGQATLITGAGASLALHAESYGMPPVDTLLESAYRLQPALYDGIEATPVQGERYPLIECLCQPTPSAAPRDTVVETLEQFIEQRRRGAALSRMKYDLVNLLTLKANSHMDESDSDAFVSAIRCAMVGFDQGFLFQHWLMAHLRWHAIITTNFDSFHERAAMKAVTTSSRRISDANIVMKNALATEAIGSDSRLQPGVFKPYGHLTSSRDIALTFRDLFNRRERLATLFERLLPTQGRGVIAIVGHRLKDVALREVLEARLENYKMFWVVPEPEPEMEPTSTWRLAVADGKVTKLDATALDFSYDLYSQVRSLGQS